MGTERESKKKETNHSKPYLVLSGKGGYPFELILGRYLVVLRSTRQVIVVEVALDLVHAVLPEAA